MFSSFVPINQKYNYIDLFRKKSQINTNKSFNGKLMLPNIRYYRDLSNYNIFDYSTNTNNNNINYSYSNSLNQMIKPKKNRVSKGVGTNFYNKKVNEINISSNIIDNKENEKNESEIKDILKKKMNIIKVKKNIIKFQNNKKWNNINFWLFNKSNNNETINRSIVLKKNYSLPRLKNMPVKSFNKEEKHKCNYIFLEYKGKKMKNEYNKKTYIQISPHKVINQLRTISLPFGKCGIKIFSLINKIINNANSKINEINHNINQNKDITVANYVKKEKLNISLNKSNNNNNNDYNISFLENIYDKYILPDKNNKYNFIITRIFFSDVMDKVMKKMVEIRDIHNKLITQEEIEKEYKNQINKLQIYLHQKTNNIKYNNNEISILEQLNLINNNINKDKLINNNNNDNNMNRNVIQLKMKNSLSDINLKFSKNMFSLGPITERKILDNSKVVDFLNHQKVKKDVSENKNNNNKCNNENKNYNQKNGYEFGQNLNFVVFEDICKELEKQYDENNYRKKNNKNMDSILNLIL